MTTQAQTVGRTARADGGRFYRNVLRVDGVVTTLLGLLIMIESAWLPGIMGAGTTAVYMGLGAVVAGGGAVLLWLSTKTLGRRAMIAVLALAAFCVVDGVMLLFSGWIPLTTAGFWIVAAVTDLTALMGIAYYVGLRRAA